MEPILQRLSSEDSAALSEDSYEYYQTDIYELLPSTQRRKQYRDKEQVAEGDGDDLPPLYLDWDPRQPLKTLPLCMQDKRNLRDQQHPETRRISYWESWRRSQETAQRRMKEQIRQVLSGLLPWKLTLHKIEGRFGVGVKAFFVFLRYLLCLNLLNCLITGCVLIPFLYTEESHTPWSKVFQTNDSFLDIFLGSGFMERSPVFYRFYTSQSSYRPCLKPPFIFFFGLLTIFFLSLLMIVRRAVVGYKHTWLSSNHFKMNKSHKVFCAWDFCIQDPQAASLKHSVIRNELKMDLEEQKYRQKVLGRSLKQWVLLYALRLILNFVVIVLLVGSIALIWYATLHSKKETFEYSWIVNLLLSYLPPITITLVNFVLPHVFAAISVFEDYSLTSQLNVTLVRWVTTSILLKLGTLAIYLFFLNTGTKVKEGQCEEAEFGKAMYKLTVFHLLACFCNDFLVAFSRKLLVEKWPSSNLARKAGKQKFVIPLHVLDLVYSQTVTWVGVFYCPLLPAISMLKLLIMFYLKKFTVTRCCVPPRTMFRTSSSSVLFHFMLLLGLIMSAVTLCFNINRFVPGGCGPFQGYETVFNVTYGCVVTLPYAAQTTIRYATSEAFAFSIILAEIIILTSYVSRGKANHKTIENLKDLLVMSSSDKRFLVKQHTTLQRGKKKTIRGKRRATSPND